MRSGEAKALLCTEALYQHWKWVVLESVQTPSWELSKPNQVQPGAAGDGEVTPGGSSLAGFVLNEKSFLWCCHIGLPMGLFIRPFPTISGLGQRGPMEGSLRDPKALQHSGSLLTPVLQSPCKEIATTM